MTNVYAMAFLILAALLFYRYAVPRFRRFDAENVRRIQQQEQDRQDPTAHIRHALDVAAEQVEAVQEVRTGAVTHYLFEAAAYATREEAEEMRARRIGAVARRFYDELPTALGPGRAAPCCNLTARERAAQRWRRTFQR